MVFFISVLYFEEFVFGLFMEMLMSVFSILLVSLFLSFDFMSLIWLIFFLGYVLFMGIVSVIFMMCMSSGSSESKEDFCFISWDMYYFVGMVVLFFFMLVGMVIFFMWYFNMFYFVKSWFCWLGK